MEDAAILPFLYPQRTLCIAKKAYVWEDGGMDPRLKRGVVFAAAIILIILGVIGLALPFLQGFLFLAIGLILLSIASPRARAWIEHHTRKYPKVHAFVEKMEKRITNIIGMP